MSDAPLRAPRDIHARRDTEADAIDMIVKVSGSTRATAEMLVNRLAAQGWAVRKTNSLVKVEDDQKNLDILKENEARFRRKMTDKYYDIEVERITQRIARSRAPR